MRAPRQAKPSGGGTNPELETRKARTYHTQWRITPTGKQRPFQVTSRTNVAMLLKELRKKANSIKESGIKY